MRDQHHSQLPHGSGTQHFPWTHRESCLYQSVQSWSKLALMGIMDGLQYYITHKGGEVGGYHSTLPVFFRDQATILFYYSHSIGDRATSTHKISWPRSLARCSRSCPGAKILPKRPGDKFLPEPKILLWAKIFPKRLRPCKGAKIHRIEVIASK